jgi:hypothetical protein
LNINTNETIAYVQVFDVSGKLVLDIAPRTAGLMAIDISALKSGLYIASVKGEKLRFAKH